MWNVAYSIITNVEITVSPLNFTKFSSFKQFQTVIVPFNNQILNFKQVKDGNFTVCIHLLSFNEYER